MPDTPTTLREPQAPSEAAANAATLEREIAWFEQVLQARFRAYFQADEREPAPESIAPPALDGDRGDYAAMVRSCAMNVDERLVLMLAMMPHLRPQALDFFFSNNKELGRGFTEFGGWKGKIHGGFLPTCETAVFLLAGDNLVRRFSVMQLFGDDHFFARKRLIRIRHEADGEPFFGATLDISTEYLNRFTTGSRQKPDYGAGFPAKLITTRLAWSDLVLNPEVRQEVDNLTTWLRHSATLLQDWGLERSVKPGYRCLFYGPPGTGKTLTATLIGLGAGVDVYRIDLSMLISKYIGETAKNLAGVFDQAEEKNWILFFDEADSLFGKRTDTSSSNDRHANQEISYLLQRVEEFPGVVILASNLKANIDEAFARRFQSTVYFAMPEAEQRLLLWRGMFRDPARLGPDVNLEQLAEQYELAGGAITNVVRYAAIRAIRMQRGMVAQDDLLAGIGKELTKEGRTL